MASKSSKSARQNYSTVAQNYSAGLDLTSSPENLKPNQLTQGINCRFSKQGGVFVRGGYQNVATLGTGYPVTDIEPMPQYNAMFCKSGTKVFQTSDGTAWYDVGMTVTASERSNFFSLFKDMYFMNNVDPFTRISVSRLSADADLVGNKLTLLASDATGFAQTGTVYVRGIPVTYNPYVTATFYSPPVYTTNYPTTNKILTSTGHGLSIGSTLICYTSGVAPNGISTSPQVYYVIAENFTANQFEISTSNGGSAITYSDNGTGTQTFRIQGVTQWTVTAANHGLPAMTNIELKNTGGVLPSGLDNSTTYYVLNPTANTFQLAIQADLFSPVQFTTNGSGTNQYLVTLNGGILPTASGLTSAMKKGDLVTQVYQQLSDGAATSFTTCPYNPVCMATIEQITFIAGDPKAPHVIYQAVPYNFGVNEQNPYDFTTTNNGAATVEMPTSVTCLKTGNNLVLIGTKMGIHYSSGTDPTTAKLFTHPISYDHGVPNQRCIVSIDTNSYVVFTGRRFLMITKDVYGVRIADDPQNPETNFDYPIRKYLQANADQDQSQAWCHFDPVLRELHGAVMINKIKQIFVCNIDLRAWSIDQDKNFACEANFNYRVWAGSDDKNFVYLDNEGRRDDTFITHAIWSSPVYTVDQKRITADYESVAFAGLLSPTGSFLFRIYVNDLLVNEYNLSAVQFQKQGLMTVSMGNPVGGAPLGVQTVGTGGNLADTFYFNCPIQLLASGEKFRMEWEVIDEGTALEIRDSKMDAEHSGTLYASPF